jgi:hypothetical protein
MVEPHSIAGLKTKRQEIEGYIRATEKRLARARQDLIHVNCTIRLFEADADTPDHQTYVSTTRMFQPGELPRLCIAALQAAPDGLADSRQITEYVAQQKGWDASDRTFMIAVSRRVTVCLSAHSRRYQRFEKVRRRNGAMIWRLK